MTLKAPWWSHPQYARDGDTLTTLVGNPLDEFPISLKNWWCGWDSLPPGFLPPVKGQVASLEWGVDIPHHPDI
jgi:hypothetical protein